MSSLVEYKQHQQHINIINAKLTLGGRFFLILSVWLSDERLVPFSSVASNKYTCKDAYTYLHAHLHTMVTDSTEQAHY